MKIGRAKTNAVSRQRLLEPEIVPLALLGLKVGIREEIECRKADEELREAWGFEPGTVAGLELRPKDRNQIRRRNSPGRFPAKPIVVIVTTADRGKQSRSDLRLQFGKAGDVIVFCGDRALEETIRLIFHAKNQSAAFPELDVPLPVELDPVAVINVFRRKTKPGIGRLDRSAVIRVADANAILERAIKKREVRFAPRKKL